MTYIRTKQELLIEKLIPVIESKTILKEGLIKSVSVEQAFKILNRLGYNTDHVADPFNKKEYFKLYGEHITSTLTVRFDKMPEWESLKNFMRISNTLGYFVSFIDFPDAIIQLPAQTMRDILINKEAYLEIKKKLATQPVTLILEPKYDMEVSKYLTKSLYHITPAHVYANKISKIGLSPRS